MSEPKPIPAKPRRCLRPRDAASLLLVDRSGATPRILMGRRHSSLAFMPGKFVFPGGRADPADGAIAAASELSQNDTQKLLKGMGARASLRRARALGLCAIRETFEETGLRIAHPASAHIVPPKHEDWCAFLERGMLPQLDSLRYFARAVTPPGNVRRFDTRFFIAFCDSLPEVETQKLVPSGELEDLDWVLIDQIEKLDLARITQAILNEATALLMDTQLDLPATLPVVQYSKRHDRFVREVI
ncbi:MULTISPECIES: NUDIX hydrolase [Brucella]|uniref:NUDIX hydrolase n=1 Tax=Brucella TaxID=234 RepID=UPI0001B48A0E|nr:MULTISPECIES: NUDIX hydrolase [Brucella]AIJ69840.1 NUDIX domain protein [Brucella suis bv. 3 str. 686]MXF80553.1 NUDIX hydrolase [Brucella melitensis]QOK62127.1 NUDIX hydrolase [Brucella suis bv. 3]